MWNKAQISCNGPLVLPDNINCIKYDFSDLTSDTEAQISRNGQPERQA